MVAGAGFLLNNEMGDFNLIPGRTDTAGRIGTPANLIAPGKRMLSSQTPTLVLKDGRVRVVTGSPGGRTIPNTTLWVVLNLLEFGLNPATAVDAPRTHHQWFPDVLVPRGAILGPGDPHGARGHGAPPQARDHRAMRNTIVVDRAAALLHGVADRRRATSKAAGD